MSDLFDYLSWRGDLPLDKAPFCPVDALVLSILSYLPLGGQVPAHLPDTVTIHRIAGSPTLTPGAGIRFRCEEDYRLLRALGRSLRFGSLALTYFDDQFRPKEEMQFAAVSVLLPGGSAFLSFRGTDSTLVGWKEDFNMSFLDTVPAQRASADYARRLAAAWPGGLRLGGHSKGGNLAVFAASLCPARYRDRIQAVYNFDGPGFTPHLLSQPGYRELLTRIETFLPQSSVVGMLLEHEEPYTVIRSNQVGLLQHDPYSWQVEGGDFIRLEEVTAGSRRLDRALKSWLAGLTPEERGTIVDTLYALLSSGDAKLVAELIQPRNLATALRALRDTPGRDLVTLAASIGRLARSTVQALQKGLL